MEHIKFSSQIKKTSRLAWGMWRFEGDVKNAEILINQVLETQINFFDTADIYGTSEMGYFGACEDLLGKVFENNKGLRQKIILATKGGIVPGLPYNSSKEYLISALDASLKRLKTDVIDIYQIHRPDNLAHPEIVAGVLDNMISSGKVRAIGLSNYKISQIMALDKYLGNKISCIQPEVSLLEISPFENGILDYAMQQDFKVLAWSPLGGGRLLKPKSPIEHELNACLNEMARKYESNIANIALAWLLRHPSKIIPIIGSQNIENIKSCTKALSINLKIEDWYKIFEIACGQKMP